MGWIGKLFGSDSDDIPKKTEQDPKTAAKEELEKMGSWPTAKYHDIKGEYSFYMDSRDIAKVAGDYGLINDDEFKAMITEAVKNVNMTVGLNNIGLRKMRVFCESEAAKYSE